MMRTRRKRVRRRAKARRREQEQEQTAQMSSGGPEAKRAKRDRLPGFYAAGPMFGLGPAPPEPDPEQQAEADSQPLNENEATDDTAIEPVAPVQGRGPSEHVTVYGNGNSVRLRGETIAEFSSGYETQNVVGSRAKGCPDCPKGTCIHVKGTLVATYAVDTTVTLPQASDFPDLTPCQHQRVQHAIDTVLAPHEQEHVDAFNTYRGATRRPFDLTICRNAYDGKIKSMFEAEEQKRRKAAKDASKRLDPFHFDVDLNCTDKTREDSDRQAPEPDRPDDDAR